LSGFANGRRAGLARVVGRAVLMLVLAIAGMAASARAAEKIPPAPTTYVTDEAGVLSADGTRQLNQLLDSFERESSSQIIVAIYPTMESDSSIEDYTVRVAQSWRVGQKGRDNGAILFAFMREHRAYIQVGYGLEPRLTDALCRRIIDHELKPAFRSGQYDAGIRDTVTAMIAAARGEYQGSGGTANDRSGAAMPGARIVITVILFLLVGGLRFFSRPVSYRGGRSSYFGGMPVILSGGRSSGGGGFSGGGGGGFSGGGGSFGGGGAGGSW
jgi:uncharacterized protein